MKLLAIANDYPHPGYPFSGVFNERCVGALKELCDGVQVLAPRPYVPPLLSFVPRWKAYAAVVQYEVRDQVCVYRPATPVLPRIASALWVDLAAFLWCRRIARKMHDRTGFDAVISFDLVGAGGLAWRIGRELGIPASGWGFGDDVRFPRTSPLGQVVMRAIQRLDLVFYQSRELLEKAAGLLGMSPACMSRSRHVILSHGIPEPPSLPKVEIRNRIRSAWGISDDQVMVLNIGRIAYDKGVFDLLEAISSAAAVDPRITCVLVGSNPAFDETKIVQKRLHRNPALQGRVTLIPGCRPAQVWEYLCAADLFAFPSHKEGMPNSLLEAMAMGVPAVAFAIPPVLEIDGGTGALVTVPPLDTALFAKALIHLAVSADERVRIGEKGRIRVRDCFMVRQNMARALHWLSQIVVACQPS